MKGDSHLRGADPGGLRRLQHDERAAYAADNSTLRWTGPPRSTLIGCEPALADQQFDHHETGGKVVRVAG
jgi:hypothetical protein